MCGGASVPEALIATYQDRGLVFCQGYGLTETAPGATFLEAGESSASGFGRRRRCSSADVRVDPAETRARSCPGPNVTPGYWTTSGGDGRRVHRDGWFRSGDVGRSTPTATCTSSTG